MAVAVKEANVDIFESLTNDHRIIARVLTAFEQFITEAEASETLDLVEFGRFTVFFREFVELWHHEREENLLLPAMESIGYARNAAPIVHIREDHERERNHLLELRRAAVRLRPLQQQEKSRVLAIARDLVTFERTHMKKENELLYPALQRELSAEKASALNRPVLKAGSDKHPIVEQIWLRALADELVHDHPVPAHAEGQV